MIDLTSYVSNISKALYSVDYSGKDLGLHSGISGTISYLVQEFYFSGNKQSLDLAYSLVELGFSKINSGYSYPTYCSGIAGFNSVLLSLYNEKVFDFDFPSIVLDLDDYLFKQMMLYLENGVYDFLHGASGIACYFLDRVNLITDLDSDRYIGYLKEYIKGMRMIGIHDPDSNGIKYVTNIIPSDSFVYNFGLSHGMASIVSVICKMSHVKELRNESIKILSNIVRYISSIPTYKSSFFPNWITIDGEHVGSERLAWCYGDLGISIMFKHLCDLNLREFDYFIGFSKLKAFNYNLIEKSSFTQGGIWDPGLCHGTSGLAVYLLYLYELYGDDKILSSANNWIYNTTRFLDEFPSMGGCFQFVDTNGGERVENFSFLEGASGIGLSFLDFSKGKIGNWSKYMLF